MMVRITVTNNIILIKGIKILNKNEVDVILFFFTIILKFSTKKVEIYN